VKVLVACEFSGIVRDAFIAAGHDAISCDLLPSERPGPHVQGDVLDLLYHPDGRATAFSSTFDLMIAHPPCTYLSNSGVRWLYGGKGTTPDPERWRLMEEGAGFFARLLTANVPRIAVENPIMHRYGKSRIRFYAGGPAIDDVQITTVQPWQFGTPETKATQLWLRNLPPLVPTNIVEGRTPRVHFASPGPNRWAERSRTDVNIAAAMADQWGVL
jgi:hypothetical protein